jgi:hypothetical protein
MDKRKVNSGGAAEDLDERASKRRKLPNVSRLSGRLSRVGLSAIAIVIFEHWRWSQGLEAVRRRFMALHHRSRLRIC